MKLERKNGDAVSRRFHVGFQLDIYIYIYRKKRRTPRGRQQNRGEDRRRGGASEAKGWMVGRARESGRKSEETRRRECEGEGKKWRWRGREEGRRNVSSSSPSPRIQSHRVYSSVHLILFIGFKAFAGTPYLRIWSILWAKDLDDTCGPSPPSVYWPSMKLYRHR